MLVDKLRDLWIKRRRRRIESWFGSRRTPLCPQPMLEDLEQRVLMAGNGVETPPFIDGQPSLVVDLNPSGRELVQEFTNNTEVFIDPVGPNTVVSTIEVEGIAGNIRDINLELNIRHTYNSDLITTLISPSGTRVILFTRVGSSLNHFTNTILDDEADSPITAGNAPFTGTFRPQQNLSGFDGQDPNGTWTLEVQDVASQDGGMISNWTLQLATDDIDDTGLIAYWNFNEGSGAIAGDSSPEGDNHPGTLRADAAFNEFGLRGSLTLDGGAGDEVRVSNSASINLTTVRQRTISLWFNADDAGLAREQVLYEQGAEHRGMNIYIENGQLFVGGWNRPESETNWQGTFLSTPITTDGWHHVALVLDGSGTVQPGALTGYLDGVAFGSGDGSLIRAHSGKIAIGGISGNTRLHDGVDKTGGGFQGLIDEVRIYDRVLAPGEIASLASAILVDPSDPPPPPPPPGSEFTIEVRFTDSSLTAAQRAVFQGAADRWSEIIIGDLPDVNTSIGLVDDVVIDARGVFIDGEGGILGSAGPTQLRQGTFLPARGSMRFDSADLASLLANGALENVILHEMGHVLGIGTIWSNLGLLQGAGTSNPVFTGQAAQAEYADLFGLSGPTPVPVANTGGAGTRDSHWRESVFRNELMTGFLNSGVNPISRMTAASLIDIGYEIDLSAADPYTPPSLLANDLAAAPALGPAIGPSVFANDQFVPPVLQFNNLVSGPAQAARDHQSDHLTVSRPYAAVLPEEAFA